MTAAYHYLAPDPWLFLRVFVRQFWPILLACLWYPGALFLSRKTSLDAQRYLTDLAFIAALIGTSWGVFLKVWSYDNDYLPACLAVALLVGLSSGYLFQKDVYPLFTWQKVAVSSFFLLLLMELGMLVYKPTDQLPTELDRQAATAFIDKVRSLPGEVWIFSHGYYGWLAGKNTYFTSVPFGDIVGGKEMPPNTDQYKRREKAKQVYRQAIQSQEFYWIVLDKQNASMVPPYIVYSGIDLSPNAFYPVTGAPSKPKILLAKSSIIRPN